MLTLRNATKNDGATIVQLIHALADYEKLSHECHATQPLIEQWLFGETPRAYCVMAEWGHATAGFALYFYNFSTFLSQPGIYLEDLYVVPEFRRKGIAKAIFSYLARKAVSEGCGRLEWWVLDWNADAIAFYAKLGAQPMDDWTVQRIEGNSLQALASQDF